MTQKQGRNELCSCGSGKKFKKCCDKTSTKRVFSLHNGSSGFIAPLASPTTQTASLGKRSIKAISQPKKSILTKQD